MNNGKLEVAFEKSDRNLNRKLVKVNQYVLICYLYESLLMTKMREDIETIPNKNQKDKRVI